jgi:serine/threonine protein kinase
MPSASVAALIDQIQELTLLDDTQLDELPRLAAGCADGARLLLELQRRRWLTAYQGGALQSGQGAGLVLGPYVLLDLLGQGAVGKVYLARHAATRREVALKVIAPEALLSPQVVRRFDREVFIAAQLSHPNIVAAHDAGQVGGVCYLAMEHVRGIDLARLVREHGPLPLPMACDLARQAALALQHAHDQELIHRDVKPSNVMVVRSPDHPPLAKVLDFGLARMLMEAEGAGRLTQVGGVVGTVDYIAPEQAADARRADARSDVFSLGATLFYLLTGKPPFAGKDILERITARVVGTAPRVSTLRQGVPPVLDAVIARLMARDPAHRFGRAAEAAAALEPFCRPEAVRGAAAQPALPPLPETLLPRLPAEATPAAVEQRPARRKRSQARRLFLAAASSFAVVVGVGGLVLGVALLSRARRGPPEEAVPARKEGVGVQKGR